ncbi:hypothetical protein H4O18_15385 [Arenibacter sp. BSSL-BM3]|uniref:Carboxypeptidase regulatory-like domain-containing protein n=1 Tax=Arenibacter arenosicollis TaxID=2762274 RepID=A0ABR7QQM7_9FLAO|nr:hypothetical protein [Arenibacter arenosicollis]MBC8769379.1 hypothetical protein [Arenibacter arenosicollis]
MNSDILYLFVKKIVCPIIFFLLPWNSLAIQSQACDEVPVSLRVELIGEIELQSLVCEKELFLSINELFDFLKIKIESDPQLNLLEGYLQDQDDIYKIDVERKVITYKGNVYELSQTDIRKYTSGVYLREQIIYEIFGLKSTFNFRNLSVLMEVEIELPYLKEAIRNKLRQKIPNDLQIPIADTTIYKEKPLFDFGTARWNIFSTQRSDGMNYSRLGLGLGGVLMGGELSGRLNAVTDQPLDIRNQFYRWRLVNNENTLIRQLTIGKISTQTRSSIFSPIVGVQMTNAPTYRKRSFGTYILSNYTKPGWMVELFINNALVDFAKADNFGFFSFEIPLVYGNTSINLRYYGPYGEEEHSNQQITIPFNLQQSGNYEYDVNFGVVEDTGALFLQSEINYGVSQNLSLGGGLEYLSSLEKNQVIPYVNGNMLIGGQTIISAEYMPNVGYRATLNYRHRKNYHLDLFYTKYQKDQTAILYNYNEQRSAILTTPISFGEFAVSSRLALRQTVLGNNNFSNLEWLLSGNVLGINTNIHTRAFYNDLTKPDFFSRFTFSMGLPYKLTLSPQIEFNYIDNKITSVRGEISKHLFKDTYFRSNIEHNFKYDKFYLNFGVTIGLGFSRLGLSSNINTDHSSFSQILTGGASYSHEADYMVFDERTALGQASVKFLPFLDVNGNGKKDGAEPEIKGLEVYCKRGGLKKYLDTGSIIFTGMEPYVPHYFTFNSDQFQNIAWTMDYNSMNLTLNPNQIKLVKIPINVMGEVSGYVKYEQEGIGSVRMTIKDKFGEKLAHITSESDGFFSFFGLPSGEYSIQPDTLQQGKLGLRPHQETHFKIQNGEEGDYVDNILLKLVDLNRYEDIAKLDVPEDGLSPKKESEKNLILNGLSLPTHSDIDTFERKSINKYAMGTTGNQPLPESTYTEKESLLEISDTNNFQKTIDPKVKLPGLIYSVQIRTSKKKLSPTNPIFKDISDISYYINDGNYSYTWRETTNYNEALELRRIAVQKGHKDSFVIYHYNGERISHEKLKILKSLQKELFDLTKNSSNELRNSIVNDFKGKDRNTSSYNFEVVAKPTPKEVHQPLVFNVQLMETPEQLESGSPIFDWLPTLKHYREGPKYKYFLEGSKNLNHAVEIRKTLIELGFDKAIIVPFDNLGILNPLQAEGKVLYQDLIQLTGMAGIPIKIYNVYDEKVETYLSEADGKFQIRGLPHGNYKVVLDTSLVRSYKMRTPTNSFLLSIKDNTEISPQDLNFILKPIPDKGEDLYKFKNNSGNGLVFKVQILASNMMLPQYHNLFKGLKGIYTYQHKGVYKYAVGDLKTLEEARDLKLELKNNGFPDAFIVSFYNEKRLDMLELAGCILIEQDSVREGMIGMKIHIYQKDNLKSVTTLVSGREGHFNFLGLKPGKYKAKIDSEQLRKLGLVSVYPEKDFEITLDGKGSQVKPLIFEVSPLP